MRYKDCRGCDRPIGPGDEMRRDCERKEDEREIASLRSRLAKAEEERTTPVNLLFSGDGHDAIFVEAETDDGRSVRFTAYLRLPLSSGITRVFSDTIMPNDNGRTPLRVEANRNGAVFCGYAIDAGDGVRLEVDDCEP